jgi:hypothetical protein
VAFTNNRISMAMEKEAIILGVIEIEVMRE